ncbi:MAG: hypothetical protein ABII82_09190 [Verrucomicrobiota bacterium]
MRETVFFLEESSARALLVGLLPRLGFDLAQVRFVVFEGKSDLEKQIERKLRAWLNPHSQFVILRDQDSGDCSKIKNGLVEKCRRAGHPTTLVRIACRELESWYLGDLKAVETGFCLRNLARHQATAKYRRPDLLGNPSLELRQLTANRYQKIGGSRILGHHLSLTENSSRSYMVFLSGIQSLLAPRDPAS